MLDGFGGPDFTFEVLGDLSVLYVALRVELIQVSNELDCTHGHSILCTLAENLPSRASRRREI